MLSVLTRFILYAQSAAAVMPKPHINKNLHVVTVKFTPLSWPSKTLVEIFTLHQTTHIVQSGTLWVCSAHNKGATLQTLRGGGGGIRLKHDLNDLSMK